MFGQEGKTFIRILIVVLIILPLGMMLWNIQWGVIAMVFCLATAGRAIRTLQVMQIEGTLADQDALNRKANSAQTIYVQLIDDAGNPLPATLAKERVALAQRNAGPRDTVLGVHRKVG